MLDDGLSDEQADCTITALGETLSEDQMSELIDIQEGDDLTPEQDDLLEQAFRAASNCGYDILNAGDNTTTTG
jgi:hypothetical protein